ncbi:MAG: hypothetical protein AAGA64_15570 [Bacteroidota bacterium]
MHQNFILLLLILSFLSCQKKNKTEIVSRNDDNLLIGKSSEIDSLYPHNPVALEFFNNAQRLYYEASYDSAVNEIKSSLQIEKGAQALNLAGLIYLRINKDSSIYYFEKAIKDVPSYYFAHNNLSMVFRMKGEFESSIYSSTKAIDVARSSEDLWGLYLNRCIAYTFNDEFDLAQSDLDSAKLLCPNPELLVKFETWFMYNSGKEGLKEVLN